MSRKSAGHAPRREPIRTRWIWGVFAVLFVLLNPWYFPAGSERLIAGVPLWAWVILAVCLALSVFLHFVCAVYWQTGDESDE